MATWLKNTILFANIPVGVNALPHRLVSPSGVPLIPDLVAANTVSPAGALFSVTADATNVIVTNGSGGDITVTIYVESWHTIERTFGSDNTLSLVPQPFVIGNNGSGGGGGPGPAVVAPPPTDIASVLGGSLLYARQDHTHETGLAVAVNGGAPSPNRAHTLNLTGTAITGLVSAAGVATYTIDAGAFVGAGVPTQIQNVAASAGVSVLAARADHVHNVSFANVLATGTANAAGVAASLALSDHVHQTNVLVQDEGIAQGGVHTFNFVGAGVTAAVALNVATITIPGAGGVVDLQTAYNNGAAGIQAIQESVANLGISIRDIPAGTNNPIFAVTDSGGSTVEPYLHVRARSTANPSVLMVGNVRMRDTTATITDNTPLPILQLTTSNHVPTVGGLSAYQGAVNFNFSSNFVYDPGFLTTAALFSISAPAVLGSSATAQFGNYANMYIDGNITVGANATITNRWAMMTAGGNTAGGGVAGAATWTAKSGGFATVGQIYVAPTNLPNNVFNEDLIVAMGDGFQSSIAARIADTGGTQNRARFIAVTNQPLGATRQIEMIAGGNAELTSTFGVADSASARLVANAPLMIGTTALANVRIGVNANSLYTFTAGTGVVQHNVSGFTTDACIHQLQTDVLQVSLSLGGSTTAGTTFGYNNNDSFIVSTASADGSILLQADNTGVIAAGIGTVRTFSLTATDAYMTMDRRFETLRSATNIDVTTADATIVLGGDGNVFNVRATAANASVSHIDTTGWQLGSTIIVNFTTAEGGTWANPSLLNQDGGAGELFLDGGIGFQVVTAAIIIFVRGNTGWAQASPASIMNGGFVF